MRHFLLWVLLFLLSQTGLEAKEIAIIPSKGCEDLAALIQVELSQYPEISILERGDIDLLTKEVSLRRFFDESFLSNLQLQGAQAILLLDTEVDLKGKSQGLQFRLLDCKSAEIISALDLSEIDHEYVTEKGCAILIQKIRDNISKIGRVDKLPTVSVNRFRASSSGNSEALKRARVLSSHVERLLSAQPDLIVLERSGLTNLQFENLFAVEQSQFLSSSFVVDGFLDTDADEFKIDVNNGNRPSLRMSSNMELSDLAESIVAEVFAAMRFSEVQVVAPEKEAANLLREAKWAYAAGMLWESIDYATSAELINPKLKDSTAHFVYQVRCEIAEQFGVNKKYSRHLDLILESMVELCRFHDVSSMPAGLVSQELSFLKEHISTAYFLNLHLSEKYRPYIVSLRREGRQRVERAKDLLRAHPSETWNTQLETRNLILATQDFGGLFFDSPLECREFYRLWFDEFPQILPMAYVHNYYGHPFQTELVPLDIDWHMAFSLKNSLEAWQKVVSRRRQDGWIGELQALSIEAVLREWIDRYGLTSTSRSRSKALTSYVESLGLVSQSLGFLDFVELHLSDLTVRGDLQFYHRFLLNDLMESRNKRTEDFWCSTDEKNRLLSVYERLLEGGSAYIEPIYEVFLRTHDPVFHKFLPGPAIDAVDRKRITSLMAVHGNKVKKRFPDIDSTAFIEIVRRTEVRAHKERVAKQGDRGRGVALGQSFYHGLPLEVKPRSILPRFAPFDEKGSFYAHLTLHRNSKHGPVKRDPVKGLVMWRPGDPVVPAKLEIAISCFDFLDLRCSNHLAFVGEEELGMENPRIYASVVRRRGDHHYVFFHAISKGEERRAFLFYYNIKTKDQKLVNVADDRVSILAEVDKTGELVIVSSLSRSRKGEIWSEMFKKPSQGYVKVYRYRPGSSGLELISNTLRETGTNFLDNREAFFPIALSFSSVGRPILSGWFRNPQNDLPIYKALEWDGSSNRWLEPEYDSKIWNSLPMSVIGVEETNVVSLPDSELTLIQRGHVSKLVSRPKPEALQAPLCDFSSMRKGLLYGKSLRYAVASNLEVFTLVPRNGSEIFIRCFLLEGESAHYDVKLDFGVLPEVNNNVGKVLNSDYAGGAEYAYYWRLTAVGDYLIIHSDDFEGRVFYRIAISDLREAIDSGVGDSFARGEEVPDWLSVRDVAVSGDLDRLKSLVALEPRVLAVPSTSLEPSVLLSAMRSGNTHMIKWVLTESGYLSEVETGGLQVPVLWQALRNQDKDMVELVLRAMGGDREVNLRKAYAETYAAGMVGASRFCQELVSMSDNEI